MTIIEVEAAERQALASLFHALADPTRLLILEHLRTGEHNVRQLTGHLGLAQSTVSAHLSCLRENRLVAVRTQGRSSFYSLACQQPLVQLLNQAGLLAPGRAPEHQWHENHQQDRQD